MYSNFSKITSAINRSKKIHVYFRKLNQLHCSVVNPLGVFAYKKSGEYEKQLYLVAFDGSIKKMYLLTNIEDVEVTDIGFIPKSYTLKDMLEGTKFILKNAIEVPETIENKTQLRELVGSNIVVPSQVQEYGKIYNLLDYYSKCLYKESMQSLEILKNNKDYYFPSIDNYVTFLDGAVENRINLDNTFLKIYEGWVKKLRENPELKIYVGYPIIEYRDRYIPLMFYRIEYNEEVNCIEYNGAPSIINSQFLNTELELLDDEINKIKSHILAQQLNKENIEKVFNNHFLQSLDQGAVDFKGIMFQHENLVEQTAVIKDLRTIKVKKEEEISNPLKRLVDIKVASNPKDKEGKLNNIVISNKSQEKAVRNVFNNITTVIQGPPGTGKTQTILNIISNNIAKESTTLVSSYNNKAVDNIVDKLKKKDRLFPFVLRVGNQDMRKEAVKSIRSIINWSVQEVSLTEINSLEETISELRNVIHEVEKQLIQIEKLEAKSRCLKEIIEEKKLSLIKAEFSNQEKVDSILADKISELGKVIISEFNSILITVQDMEVKKFRWYNRLLLRFGYPYEEKCCSKILKNLQKHIRDILEIQENKNFQDIRFIVASIILYISYKLLVEEQLNVEQNLSELDKDELICTKEKSVEAQLEKTRTLLYSKQINRIVQIPDEEKHELKNLLDQYEENIFTKSERGFKIITKYFPVWVTTNLGAPSSIPSWYQFDIGIIDEASQSTIPSAIPVISRSGSMVIVGDDKQLSPIVKSNVEEDEELLKECLEEDKDFKYLYSKKSIFDVYKIIEGQGKVILLDEHYRCDAQIIQFSNKNFYGGQLQIMTKHNEDKGVLLKDVKGGVEYGAGGKSAYNTSEVSKIKDLLIELSLMHNNKSIGIITPFRNQKRKLDHMLSELFKKEKLSEEHKNNITIGTVHTFQGDEKDIIIYSPVISEGSKSGTVQWLNQMDNLFNVAITRAREEFILVGDLHYLENNNEVLKRLIRYARKKIEKNQEKLVVNSFEGYKSTGLYGDFENCNTVKLLNPGERKLHEQLIYLLSKTDEYMIVPKIRVADVLNLNKLDLEYTEFRYGLSAHFDFVIFDCNTLAPLRAIELDGKYHNKDLRTIQNDHMKNKLCTLSQFRIIRVIPQELNQLDILKEKILG